MHPWYTRSPWKDALSHSIAVVVAILCTLAIKECAGVTVPVEAASSPRPTSTIFAVAPVVVSAAPSAATAPAAAAPAHTVAP